MSTPRLILISARVLEGRTTTCVNKIRDDVINAGANYVDEEVVSVAETARVTTSNLCPEIRALLYSANPPAEFTQAADPLVAIEHYAHPGRLVKLTNAAGVPIFNLESVDAIEAFVYHALLVHCHRNSLAYTRILEKRLLCEAESQIPHRRAVHHFQVILDVGIAVDDSFVLSLQRNPSSSPWRIPVVSART